MSGFWAILGMEPTRDVSAIKRAYAEKTRTCHPEVDPEGFLNLRKAYETALEYAASGISAAQPPVVQGELPVSYAEDDGWYLHDNEPEAAVNPYVDGEAIQNFMNLYTGNQRKDSKQWMEYFTSDAFLAAGWDSRFTALLLEKVTEAEQTLLPCKEFLMWLCTVYQFSVKGNREINNGQFRAENQERQVELCPGAEFDGLESILRIVVKGPIPKRLGGDELALRESFKDYRHLVRLAESGTWNEQAMEEYLFILNRYVLFYIKERCDPKANPDYQRHPAGLRIILHFFRRDDLPERLYQEAWRKLDLKSAIMGRAKIFYGPLRELTIERVPGIEGEKAENFLQLNRDCDAYLSHIKTDPKREDEESAAFFQREDLQKALRSPRFVSEQLLTYTHWRREGIGVGLLRRMLEFYRENLDIPRAKEVVKGLEEDLRDRVVEVRNQEDAQAEACPQYVYPTLRYRPLFRYWLNTAFFTVWDSETERMLLEYLDKNLPYQADWSRRFVEREGQSQPPRTVVMCMEVEADFYPRHIEYRVHGKPVYQPCLPFEQVMRDGGEWFLFLLPLTVAPYDWFPSVEQEILLRTDGIDMTKEERALIAQFLAEYVCCLPMDEYTGEPVLPKEVLPLTMFAETEEQLFGCSWMEGGSGLTLFEQVISGRRVRKQCEVETENAEAEARRLLAEAVSHTNYDFSMLRELPLEVYVLPMEGSEYILKQESVQEMEDEMNLQELELNQGELVTKEALSELLGQFAQKKLRRLELKWYAGSLVLVKDSARYACFFFERGDGCDTWNSMLSKPEIYQTVESDEITYVPFGMGKLEDYCIHKSPTSILQNIEHVFPEMGKEHIAFGGPSGWLWNGHVNRHNGQHKLLMAQQKLGGFPPSRSRNHLTKDGFVFSRYPIEIEKETLGGERERIELRSGIYGLASASLLEFMRGKLTRLRLTWTFKIPEPSRKHMVLLQDCGRFLMAWLQDDQEQIAFCAAQDSRAEKETFLGSSVSAKLLHRDLECIRNCVDLMLDDIDYTELVVKQYFLPVAEQSYGDILSLLLRD